MEVEWSSKVNNEIATTLDKCILKIIKREGYLKCEIDKRCVSTNGGNYLGVLYEIDVKGKTKNGKKEINIFAKRIIDIESYQVISISDLYNNELFVYKELSNIFAALQENANVPTEERYKVVKAYEESNSEVIILENMVNCGFQTYYRMDAMSLKFVEESVKNIARFHGLSFVLREKRPEYFDKKIKSIKYPFNFKDDWTEMAKSVRDISIDHIDVEYKDKMEKAYANLAAKYAEYQNEESIKACLCHGDYKLNNILVRLQEGELQEIIAVDYQLIHYGCPVFDFLYFLFSSTDRNFRKVHITNLKDLYYETLTNFLKYFDIDTDVVYPRKEFENIYKERLDYGILSMMVFLPFFFASEENVPDMSKTQSDISFQLDDRFKERFRGIIEDFVEWGYI